MAEPIVIPTDGQVAEIVSYLEEQAKFHYWQADNKVGTGAAGRDTKARYIKKAELCEGWAMGLPRIIEDLRNARAK